MLIFAALPRAFSTGMIRARGSASDGTGLIVTAQQPRTKLETASTCVRVAVNTTMMKVLYKYISDSLLTLVTQLVTSSN